MVHLRTNPCVLRAKAKVTGKRKRAAKKDPIVTSEVNHQSQRTKVGASEELLATAQTPFSNGNGVQDSPSAWPL